MRHNKGTFWAGTEIQRRRRFDGSAVAGEQWATGGLPIPPEQLLPFFLAARSAISPGQDLLGEALSSSYEAFRHTRQGKVAVKDEQEEVMERLVNLGNSRWYLGEFDRALECSSGLTHPKIAATVRRAVDLWETGEKVLVFAFYRHTCKALRTHISEEIERRITAVARREFLESKRAISNKEVEKLIKRAQRRYFDDADSPGRRAVDEALLEIVRARSEALDKAQIPDKQRQEILFVMRRFLRASTTLVRCFPFSGIDSMLPRDAVGHTLDRTDGSDLSWRKKYDGFLDFLTTQCSTDERQLYLDAALGTKTGGIRVGRENDGAPETEDATVTLANVQVATGETRRDTRVRLMRAFNTPFFPDILVCSEVMGEGVDLQRFCRHVIHHDLAWNPSTIEQRTGRVDRLGCKAEGRHPIAVFLPYLAGTADERQYRVMSDREQWFRLVMGQDEVARLITADSSAAIPLPDALSAELSFRLGLGDEKR